MTIKMGYAILTLIYFVMLILRVKDVYCAVTRIILWHRSVVVEIYCHMKRAITGDKRIEVCRQKRRQTAIFARRRRQ